MNVSEALRKLGCDAKAIKRTNGKLRRRGWLFKDVNYVCMDNESIYVIIAETDECFGFDKKFIMEGKYE